MPIPLLPSLLLAAVLTGDAAVAPPPGPATPSPVVWDLAAAEHLLNRAGFGGSSAEVERFHALGLAGAVDALFAGAGLPQPEPARLLAKDGLETPEDRAVREAGGKDAASQDLLEAKRKADNVQRRLDREQLAEHTLRWFDTMAGGADPLRDRMTLFWHGLLTSSQDDVKSSFQMLRQHRLLHAGSLGSFSELLHGIAHDPAMLAYLDNDKNRKGRPNENFAREVMELFSLGEGNYTEDDIKEAARAFTGWRAVDGEFVARAGQHDGGRKTIFGVSGRFDGDDVIDLLLEQPAAAPYVAGRVVGYLEGRAPSAERAAAYGALLRQSDWSIEALLRALFSDPAFYRDEVVGTRVASPVDLLVGIARRTGIEPPPAWYLLGSRALGQHLFHPPSVKGWDEGLAWIGTGSLMLRANLAGVLVGEVAPAELVGADAGGRVQGQGALVDLARLTRPIPPRVRFTLLTAGAASDTERLERMASELLAVPLSDASRALLSAELAARRAAADGVGEERLLRGLAHLLLSLPEASLN